MDTKNLRLLPTKVGQALLVYHSIEKTKIFIDDTSYDTQYIVDKYLNEYNIPILCQDGVYVIFMGTQRKIT